MDDAIKRLLSEPKPRRGREYRVYITAEAEVTGRDLMEMQMCDVVLRPTQGGFYEVVKARYGNTAEHLPPSIMKILFGIGK